ncbi:ChaN family lipoprotein [Myxococcota bacterium]|nr:ChaN family lipoprotein [Myxococcota bacterium]
MSRTHHAPPLVLACALLFSAACRGPGPTPLHDAQRAAHGGGSPHGQVSTSTAVPDGHGRARRGAWSLPRRIVDAAHGGIVGDEAFYRALAGTRVVYFAEEHGNPHHHAAELSLIAGMFARDRSFAIGLEMVKRPFQPVIDAFLRGELDADTLKARTEWDDRWGYEFEYYRPIFEFAKAHQLPIRALNAPDELTRTISRKGLDALTAEERASLPELDLSNAAHRAILEEAWRAHAAHGGADFERFYTAQVVWDETMAEEVVRTLSAAGAPKRMVVLAGSGHVRHGHGIPSRVERRGVKGHVIVAPVMVTSLEAAIVEGGADYLWVMGREQDLPGAEI